MADDDTRYMDLAIAQSRDAMARGNRPVASLVVRDRVIAGGVREAGCTAMRRDGVKSRGSWEAIQRA